MNARALSLDSLTCHNSFAALPSACYTRLAPQPLSDPHLLHANAAAARLLGLDPAVFQSDQFLQVFAGNAPLPGGDALAAVYSGHQFGVWAGQLGDGRAHLLGEVRGPQGNWELQLKGSGRTPYSRMGDGRAVLRSSVREYLASEAMHGLGIPTTRALALVASPDRVMRETVETAAVVTRMAPSFVRFGSFEHWAAQGRSDLLQTLADYVIDRFYPECREPARGVVPTPAGPVLALLRAVTVRTAELMADWQCVGFCHGVMNTDNMSILGLTLDYGPYGFMDGFEAAHICNHSDTGGRYAWNVQPAAAQWNLNRLANALYPLVEDPAALREALGSYEPAFLGAFHARLAAKLGLAAWRADDEGLIDGLWQAMQASRADFTQTFRRLAQIEAAAPTGAVPLSMPGAGRFEDLFADQAAIAAWLGQYRARLRQDGRPDAERAAQMNRANPLYVLRNHLAEMAIRAAAEGDAGQIDSLMTLLADPYTEQPGCEAYAQLPPDWAQNLELSCSS